MITDPPTPLQSSISRTGRRYFRTPEAVYVALCAQLDSRRGYPTPSTRRALTRVDRTMRAENGDVLVSVEAHSFTTEDSAMVTEAVTAGHVVELIVEEFDALKPVTEGVP